MSKKSGRGKTKLILMGLGWAVLMILFISSMIALFSDSNIPSVFGNKLVSVTSNTMGGTIDSGSLIAVKEVKSIDEIAVDDIITYTQKGKVTTHRVIQIEMFGDNKVFKTKGDNAASADAYTVEYEDIIGKFSSTKIPVLGYLTAFCFSGAGVLVFAVLLFASVFIPAILWIKSAGKKREQILNDTVLKTYDEIRKGALSSTENKETLYIMELMARGNSGDKKENAARFDVFDKYISGEKIDTQPYKGSFAALKQMPKNIILTIEEEKEFYAFVEKENKGKKGSEISQTLTENEIEYLKAMKERGDQARHEAAKKDTLIFEHSKSMFAIREQGYRKHREIKEYEKCLQWLMSEENKIIPEFQNEKGAEYDEAMQAISTELTAIKEEQERIEEYIKQETADLDVFIASNNIHSFREKILNVRKDRCLGLENAYESVTESYEEMGLLEQLQVEASEKREIAQGILQEQLKEYMEGKLSTIDGLKAELYSAVHLKDIKTIERQVLEIDAEIGAKEGFDDILQALFELKDFTESKKLQAEELEKNVELQQELYIAEQKAQIEKLSEEHTFVCRERNELSKKSCVVEFAKRKVEGKLREMAIEIENTVNIEGAEALNEKVREQTESLERYEQELSELGMKYAEQNAVAEGCRARIEQLLQVVNLSSYALQVKYEMEFLKKDLQLDFDKYVMGKKEEMVREESEQQTRELMTRLQEQTEKVLRAKIKSVARLIKEIETVTSFEKIAEIENEVADFVAELREDEKTEEVQVLLEEFSKTSGERRITLLQEMEKREKAAQVSAKVRNRVSAVKARIPMIKSSSEARTLAGSLAELVSELDEEYRTENMLLPITRCKEAVIKMGNMADLKAKKLAVKKVEKVSKTSPVKKVVKKTEKKSTKKVSKRK